MSILSITPQLLDAVLQYITERGELNAMNRIETARCCTELNIDMATLRNVFAILQHDGLVADFNDRQSVFLFLLTPGVWESLLKGGYTAHFAIAGKELRLLEAEVKKLDKKIGVEKVAQITGIISNIYSFFPKNLMHF